MTVPFIDLAWQEARIREDRERRFAEIIKDSAYVLGSHVAEFETSFARHVGVESVVGVSGGTQALSFIFKALGIGPGDEVLTIPNTFFASAVGILEAGGRPVFADIDPKTRNFDFSILERSVTPHTKAILPVHLHGVPVDMDALRAFADAHGLLVVEDACQAHGARYRGECVGSFGNAAAFSFYPGKNLGAYGDGGAVVTNDVALARIVSALRNQGCITKYEHEYLGSNGRLDALQAAVLSAKLPFLDEWNAMRRSIADRYLLGLADTPLVLPYVLPDTEPVWHLFVVEVPDARRDSFQAFMAERGIATGIHYPFPLHTTKALSHLGYSQGDFPVAERFAEQCVSLPIYPGMPSEFVDEVIAAAHAYFNEH